MIIISNSLKKSFSDFFNLEILSRNVSSMAGDVAMYGFLFFHSFRATRTVRLGREDYLNLTKECYRKWHFQDRHSYNASGALANHLGDIGQLMEKFPDDLFEVK